MPFFGLAPLYFRVDTEQGTSLRFMITGFVTDQIYCLGYLRKHLIEITSSRIQKHYRFA